ncbi:karyopherin Kap123 [Protomyces lactucae-debilis]|uniref:Karyopherin Kap123 n=1 Tax=Protomyces lactucae-debilis TaxID=2754530 RepID=A0A1Y2FVF3_PROLT|nr:karyopherin Kap123 [Protomyces lactucae-debilis]ORY87166.1 karyopherin Kap123 [Protomyces lactucae-debilis]
MTAIALVKTLLAETTVADSQRIAVATQRLRDEVYSQPDCLASLIALMQKDEAASMRQLAAVEARKQTPKYWAGLSGSFKQTIRSSVLVSTLKEPVSLVRHASARVIASIASIDLPHGDWSELMSVLVQAATSTAASDRVIGVYIIFTLIDAIEEFFVPRIMDLFKLFSHTITDAESAEVRLTTLSAIGRLAECIDTDDTSSVKMFRGLLPSMVAVLQENVQNDSDEDAARQSFEVFQTLLVLEPHLLSKHLPDFMTFVVELACSTGVENSKRILAFSWLLACVRFRKNKVKAMKIGPMLVDRMLQVGAEDDPEDEDEDSPSQLAFRCVDALSVSLPPSHVVQPLLARVPTMLQSSSPGERKSALLCLGASLEGAASFYASRVTDILQAIANGLQDHERQVQRAALTALGSLADEFPDEVAAEHATLLSLVFQLMHSPSVTVAKSASTALITILEGLDQNQIVTYLPQLMSSFFAVLESNTDVEAKSVVVTALGSAAHAAKGSFTPFMNRTAELLTPALSSTMPLELDFRASALDCFGSIAIAIGAEQFRPFEQSVAQSAAIVLDWKHSRLKESSFYFFAALARLRGNEFGTYADVVIPWLLRSVAQDDNGETNPDDSDQPADDEDLDSEEFMNSIGINSALAMEKETASEVLGEILSHAAETCVTYIGEIVVQLTQCLDHYYEGVRRAAAGSLYQSISATYLLSAPAQWLPGLPCRVPLRSDVEQHAGAVRSAIMEFLITEDDKLVVSDVCRHLAQATRLCGPGLLGSEADLKRLCDILLDIFKREHACQIADEGFPAVAEDDEDLVEVEDDESEELEAALLDAASEVIISLSFALGDQFVQPFGLYLPFLKQLASPPSPDSSRASALAAFAEVAGGLKSGITPYTESFYKLISSGLGDENPEVRSNSAYAMGLLCEHSKLDLSSEYMTILQKLQPLFLEGENHRFAKDNAIGCTARMTLAHLDAMPLEQVLRVVVQNLPLRHDFAENQPLYRMFCYLYAQNNATVLQMTKELLPIVKTVLHGDEAQLTPQTRIDLSSLVTALDDAP